MKTTCALLLLLAASVSASEVSPSTGQRRRSLFFCFLGGCDEDTNDAFPSLFGPLCIPVFGSCQPNSNDLDYSDCTNRTDGMLGGRPFLGECGALTEVIDGFVGSTDTDGDGNPDEVVNRNPFAGRVQDDGTVNVTGIPETWLQLFPVDSLVWDIFGDEDNKFTDSIFDGAISTIFGQDSSFGKLVVVPYAVDWEPTYGNLTCPLGGDSSVVTTESPTPTCMTALGREGYYVCRTLYNPYTAEPDSKNICVDLDEDLLVPNDACGCCGGVCPETIAELECECRCDVLGINDGFTISGNLGERCVAKDFAVATIGQLDVGCSTACAQA